MASADCGSGNGPPPKLELTEEEKGVLIECRRKSLMRGLPLGIVSWLVTRTFAARSSPSSLLRRWSGLFGGMTFLFGMFVGVSSYKEECFRKIMQLENSQLKEQVLIAKGHIDECMSKKEQDGGEQREVTTTSRREDRSSGPRSRPRSHTPRHQQQQQQQQQQKDPEAPAQPDYSVEPFQQSQQPAFQNISGPTAAEWNNTGQEEADPYVDSFAASQQRPPAKGRTFDDIRAENRRRQFTPVSEGTDAEAGSPRDQDQWKRQDQPQLTASDLSKKGVRKNKYGDIIDD